MQQKEREIETDRKREKERGKKGKGGLVGDLPQFLPCGYAGPAPAAFRQSLI